MLVGASTYNLCLFKQAHWEGVAVCAEAESGLEIFLETRPVIFSQHLFGCEVKYPG